MTAKTKAPTITAILGADSMGRYAPILAGPETGAFDLPLPLTDAALKVYRIDQTLAAIPAPAERAESDLTADILAAAAKDTPDWPSAADVLEERRAAEAHQLLITAMQHAREQAFRNVYAFFTPEGNDQIITEHLRPAHDQVISKARGIITEYRQAQGLSENAILDAGPDIRAAVIEMRDLAERYGRIRQAHHTLTHGRVGQDQRGSFSAARNYLTVTGYKPGSYGPPQPMPGATTLDRVVYLAGTPDLEPWLPLPAEQDAEWLRFYNDSLPRLHPLKGQQLLAQTS